MNKLEIKKILFFIIVSILFTFNFFNVHYALDTYFTVNSGYRGYIDMFSKNGRLITALIWKIADIIKIPVNNFIILGGIFSAIICGLSIYVIFKKLNKLINKNNEKNKEIIICILSIIFIFNCMLLQNFVFAENFVMILGLYLAINAAIMVDNENILMENIIPSLILIIATCCYQGIINVYLTLASIIIFINYNNDIKNIFTKFIKVCINYIIAMGTNFAIIKFINKFILINQTVRIEGNLDLMYNILFPLKMLKSVLIETAGMMPQYLFLIILIISVSIYIYTVIKNKVNIKNIVISVIIFFIAYLSCFVPMMALSKESLDAAARLLFSIGALPGVIIILSYYLNKEINIEKIILVFMSILLIVNLANYLFISREHLITNRNDIAETKEIYKLIEKYEKENNIKVDTVVAGMDKNPKYYYDRNYYKNELTVRANYIGFIETAVLNMVSKRSFNYINMNQIQKEKYFKNIDYDKFNENQIVFENNIMYWYKY